MNDSFHPSRPAVLGGTAGASRTPRWPWPPPKELVALRLGSRSNGHVFALNLERPLA
ncbi:hypothetical protein [Nonomuraea roseola]|uniref:hypothetical protein n=1 Tax=Nonomuraea roseola TaxID=46179 RepID=UPI0031FA354D